MSKRFDGAQAAYLTLNGAIVAFLLLPIAIVIAFALNPTPYIAFPPVGVTLRWFVKFFSSPEFMNALSLSLAASANPHLRPLWTAETPPADTISCRPASACLNAFASTRPA